MAMAEKITIDGNEAAASVVDDGELDQDHR